MVQAVSTRLGLIQDTTRYGKCVTKKKFLVTGFDVSKRLPVPYREFNVERMVSII